MLLHVVDADAADTPRNHDRLVVAERFASLGRRYFILEGAEVTCEARTPKLIVEGSSPDRALDHDVQGASHAGRMFPRGILPRAWPCIQVEIRHGKPAQTRFRTTSPPAGGLVANFSTTAGRSSRKRRNACRMVVGLHLDDDPVVIVYGIPQAVCGIGRQSSASTRVKYRGIVTVSGQSSARGDRMRVLDHLEQAVLHWLPVNRPARIENLVPAMFRVDLGEHH